MRHTITKGTVNYWPNRFEACPPAAPKEGGYVNYPEKVAGIKARMRSKKFKEHTTKLSSSTTLFRHLKKFMLLAHFPSS